MGSQSFQFLNPFPIPFPAPNNNSSIFFHDIRVHRRCFPGGSRSDWSRNVNPNRRSKFRDAYLTDDYDEDDDFSSRSSATHKVWWSDGIYEDNDDDDEEFSFVQGSIDFRWISKVFQAFGWMIPAVVMSLVLGTGSGSSSILIALALPLAQSALSLAVDKLWGSSVETPRRKYRNKKRPFARRARNFRARKGKGNRTGKETGDYNSWVAGNNVSAKNESRSGRDFGGWDELDVDDQVREDRVKKVNEQRD